MTQELYSRFPKDDDLLKEFRNRALTELRKTPDLFYKYDVCKFERDDLYAHRFLGHQFFLKEDKKTLLDRSVKMVIKSFKWRKQFGVQNIKHQDLPDEYFDRKSCIRLKEDKLGRQVVVIKVNTLRKTKSGERPIGEKFLIYWIENIFQTNENGITVIIDCSDATLNNVNMDLVDFARAILKKYYPAYLGYFLVFKFPKIFEVSLLTSSSI
ncbi:motile sperm domain-containing protein 2-like [Centruroides sculpturatus]|uniref:motile sperm domain-containing protein 2-like n=1 Tax=Centruroides sculpturatus TaxID=218467 RepID=UPI000C6CB772|nr:motile sperm domain-containing protein 2-like [Centruroides sculpturatus]